MDDEDENNRKRGFKKMVSFSRHLIKDTEWPRAKWLIKTSKYPPYQTLDYDTVRNKLWTKEERSARNVFLTNEAIQYIIMIQIAVFVGFIAFVVENCVYQGHILKTRLIRHIFITFLNEPVTAYFLWLFAQLIPGSLAAIIVVYIDPKTKGSGIPMLKKYLNGIPVENYFTMKTLILKLLSLFFSRASGLVGGDDGPMLHLGAIAAHQIMGNQYLSYNLFLSNVAKRSFALFGTSVAIVLCFGSRFTGFSLIFELIFDFWSANLISKLTFSSTFGIITFVMLQKAVEGDYYSLFHMPQFEPFDYSVYEIPIFICMGVIGGLLGSLWNKINEAIMKFRLKYVQKKIFMLLEVVIIVWLSVSFGFGQMMMPHTCTPANDTIIEELQLNRFWCPINTVDVTAIFWTSNENIVLESIIVDTSLHSIESLIIFFCINFILSSITFGSNVTLGIFVPIMILGCTWGRIIYESLLLAFPEWELLRVSKYSVFGMAAQMGGTLGLSVTPLCILLGSTVLDINASFPLCVILITSIVIGNLLSHTIYETLVGSAPIISWKLCDCLQGKTAQDIMTANPICLNIRESAEYVLEVLHDHYKFTSFPVVQNVVRDNRNSGNLVGSISKTHLLAILHKRYFRENFLDWKKIINFRDFNQLSTAIETQHINIFNTLEPDEIGKSTIEMDYFMNPFPCRVTLSNSAEHLFTLYRGMNFHHLYVVDNDDKAIGIISRRNFLCKTNE